MNKEEFMRWLMENAKKKFKADIEKALKENRRWCCICKHAHSFETAPSPSGPLDGVNCTHPELLREYGEQGDDTSKGYVNLFRVEVVASGLDCELFEKADESKIQKLLKEMESP
jgi:hypothetical protein